MSDIQRFSFDIMSGAKVDGGDWVNYQDYLADVERLKTELDKATQFLTLQSETLTACQAELARLREAATNLYAAWSISDEAVISVFPQMIDLQAALDAEKG